MRRIGSLVFFLAAAITPAVARHAIGLCGTTAESGREAIFRHRQSLRARRATDARFAPRAAGAASANRDIGNIAVIEDSDGVVARQNEFNLDLTTLRFSPTTPAATVYRYSVTDGGFDSAAAQNGAPLVALDDDDARLVSLPFAFPFFGASYGQAYVNSDGNLTFTAADTSSSARSLGRMTAGPPRISPLFDDLNPAATAGGVRTLSEASRFVVTWVSVPEWKEVGLGPRQTVQLTLYPDGRIDFSYSGAKPSEPAVVGIAPGNLKGTTALVDFRNDPSTEFSAAVAERFGNSLEIDIVTAAQKFYQTHDDAYDYLFIFNNMDIAALGDAVAYETTVRSSVAGNGVAPGDSGLLYGSPSRLQSMINMGPLSQYPSDPTALVPARASSGDTPLTALAHEAGHLFLAFASVPDPADPLARPMLGYQQAHWSFVFNSEASVLQGERILDRGAGVSPRFLTTDTAEGYAPLDQYLMGFRPSQEVPDSFLVTGVPVFLPELAPLRNFSFDGTRRDITVDELIQAMGRRTPDYTVAQRRFRFAFLLVVPQGTTPSAATLDKLETLRSQFETYYAKAASNNATADASLRRSLKLSVFPAAGVVPDSTVDAMLTLQTPAAADLIVQLQAPGGYATLPASVRIPAGSLSAGFAIRGVRPGVQEISAIPDNGAYETAAARLQVADASLLKLLAVSGASQIAAGAGPLPDPVVVRLTDANNLVYAGARITAAASAGGTVSPQAAVTDASGQAVFRWSPGELAANELQLAVERFPSVNLVIRAGSAVPVASEVLNAASFEAGIAAGGLGMVKGANLAGGQTVSAPYPWPSSLAGVQVLLNGSALPLIYVSDNQINFYVPQGTAQGAATLTVVTPAGTRAETAVEVKPLQPGIFPGAVIRSGTTDSATTTPVRAGEYVEIYCTGLGPTLASGGYQRTVLIPTVFIGTVPVQPTFSGLMPGAEGVYQVNVQVPGGLASGPQPVVLAINLAHSNQVTIQVGQ